MKILISGAGIAGTTLALLLSDRGHDITVLEKNETLLPYGQNVDVKGSAITVLKKLGLMQHVQQMHTTEAGSRFVNAAGHTYASLPQDGSTASLTAEHEILRSDLARVLYEKARTKSSISFLFGTVVKSIVVNDGEVVRLELSDGTIRSFDLVVAADGVWSKLRGMVFPTNEVDLIDQNAYAAYWTMPRQAKDNNWWNIYFADRSRIMTIRTDSHGTVRAMLTCMPSTPVQKTEWQIASRKSVLEQQEMLRKDFADAGWQAQRLLLSIDQAQDFYFQSFHQVKMKCWSSKRIVCLGDTAYAPTPLTGMGTSLAIIGAWVLAGEISQSLRSMARLGRSESLYGALGAYETKFRRFVEQSQQVVSLLPRLMHPSGLWRMSLVQGLVTVIAGIMPFLKMGSGSAESDNDGFDLPDYPMLCSNKGAQPR